MSASRPRKSSPVRVRLPWKGILEKIEKAACNSAQMADYIFDATGNSSRNSCTLVCSESKPRARRGVSFFGHGLIRMELACILRNHSPSGRNAVPSARPCSV